MITIQAAAASTRIAITRIRVENVIIVLSNNKHSNTKNMSNLAVKVKSIFRSVFIVLCNCCSCLSFFLSFFLSACVSVFLILSLFPARPLGSAISFLPSGFLSVFGGVSEGFGKLQTVVWQRFFLISDKFSFDPINL